MMYAVLGKGWLQQCNLEYVLKSVISGQRAVLKKKTSYQIKLIMS